MMCSQDELNKLIISAKEGDKEAMAEIVTNFEGMIHKIAGRFKRVTNSIYEDLLSEGKIGVILAVKNYDFDRGVKFSTYAYIVILDVIYKFVLKNNNQTVREVGILKYYNNYINENGKAPDVEEVLDKFKISKKSFDTYLTKEKLSIDDEEINCALINKIATESFTKQFEKEELIMDIRECLEKLDKKEKIILISYFGLDGEKKTQIEISKEIGLSQAGVSKIHFEALRKMKLFLTAKGYDASVLKYF